MNRFERATKKIFKAFGVLIRKYNPATSEEFRRIKLLEHYNVDLVFDIGANRGQYALGIMDAGYKGKIVSFEPLSAAYNILVKASKPYSNWEIAQRCAIGSRRQEIEINVSANLVSSTLLKMLPVHTDSAPESKIIGTEKVQVFPLDEIAGQYSAGCKHLFLKIDVEGFEQEVLNGAEATLKNAVGIEMEICMVPLYENQTWLFQQVLDFMKQEGFILTSLTPAFTNHKTGKVLQLNGIFFRESA